MPVHKRGGFSSIRLGALVRRRRSGVGTGLGPAASVIRNPSRQERTLMIRQDGPGQICPASQETTFLTCHLGSGPLAVKSRLVDHALSHVTIYFPAQAHGTADRLDPALEVARSPLLFYHRGRTAAFASQSADLPRHLRLARLVSRKRSQVDTSTRGHPNHARLLATIGFDALLLQARAPKDGEQNAGIRHRTLEVGEAPVPRISCISTPVKQ